MFRFKCDDMYKGKGAAGSKSTGALTAEAVSAKIDVVKSGAKVVKKDKACQTVGKPVPRVVEKVVNPAPEDHDD